jgi:glycosyltransferase involved in cell wall biosynthesis
MKIAVISMIRDSWGGSEELWYDMAKVALSQGHEVIHLSYEHKILHPKLKELISFGLISFQRPGITNQKIKGLDRFIRLTINYFRKKIHNPTQKLFDRHPDVLIYNGTCYSIAGEKQILKELENFNGGFFLIGHFNERTASLPKELAAIVKQAYQKAKTVFFTNQYDIKTAKIDLGDEIPNALIIRNPVNLKDKSIVSFPEVKIAQMAMVANLMTIHKGQDIVLNILKNKTWETRNWHLNIYGSGPDENYLKKLCNENKLTSKVSFHGKVGDIRALWQKNHILLMPSRMEGMPLAIVEAMLCGRPCVATNVGGISEWVEENRSGFIADTATEDSVEKALEKAWQHKDKWEEIGKHAHERAIQLYDPEPGKTLLDLITK